MYMCMWLIVMFLREINAKNNSFKYYLIIDCLNEHMAILSCKNYENFNIYSLHHSDIVNTIVPSNGRNLL